MELATLLPVFGGLRILIGLMPIAAAAWSVRWLGVPQEQDNPTARMFARLFGVRDIGLGVLVLAWSHNPEVLKFLIVLNLLTDLLDAIMIAVPLILRQGIDRAAALSMMGALSGLAAWTVALRLLP